MTEIKYIAYFNELAEANRNSARNREFYLLNSWWTAATLRYVKAFDVNWRRSSTDL